MTVHHKDLCPCGSGKRYKHCHLPIHQAQRRRVLFIALGLIVVAAGGAFAWTVMTGRTKSTAGTAASDASRPAGGTTTAQVPNAGAAGPGDAGPNAFGGLSPGLGGRSPTPAQQGQTVQIPSGSGLQPGENPTPWEYDVVKNRHYDPRPGHQHWHSGPPPADPNAADQQQTLTTNPQITATTANGTPVKISGMSTVKVAPSTPLAPGENPAPYEYDAKRNLYFDPEHKHWHEGKPPANGGAATQP